MAKSIPADEAGKALYNEERGGLDDKAASPGELQTQTPDFEKIESSAGFRNLMKKKKAFLLPTTILFLALYLIFNLTISYTNVLETSFVGDISWVWVFAFGLFAMTWILVTVYMKKAEQFDEMANETLNEFDYGKEESQ